MPKTLISILNKSNYYKKNYFLQTDFMGSKGKNLIFVPYGIKSIQTVLKYSIIRDNKIIRNNQSILLLKNGERKDYFIQSLQSNDTIIIESGDLGNNKAHVQVFLEWKE
tara:strand:+ start:1118 stop:1444 length:327 start_codon:yes stop_codon:yes gene_type:complete